MRGTLGHREGRKFYSVPRMLNPKQQCISAGDTEPPTNLPTSRLTAPPPLLGGPGRMDRMPRRVFTSTAGLVVNRPGFLASLYC